MSITPNGHQAVIARELRRGTSDSRIKLNLEEIEQRLDFWLEDRTVDELRALEIRLYALWRQLKMARRSAEPPVSEAAAASWARQFMQFELIEPVSRPRPIEDRPLTRFEHALSQGV